MSWKPVVQLEMSIFSTVCRDFPWTPRFNQAAWAVPAARCGAQSCCAWRAVIWSFAQGERQELTETLSSLKTSSFSKKVVLVGLIGWFLFFGTQLIEGTKNLKKKHSYECLLW